MYASAYRLTMPTNCVDMDATEIEYAAGYDKARKLQQQRAREHRQNLSQQEQEDAVIYALGLVGLGLGLSTGPVGNVKKHSLCDYWDYGLCRSWSLPRVKEMADQVLCIGDMGANSKDGLNIWYEENINLDLIDENIFGKW